MNISRISDNYAVAAQILPMEVAAIAEQGFVAIICNRPDGEEPGQPTSAEIAAECVKAGLAFHHIPVSGIPISERAILEQRRLIDESGGPVLAYCRSGQRSLIIWQASA
ncbi:MAG: TIGR01244 family sulfur transferase [Woeseiaceae bacterium]|nr:TIGR01244 family sulfur transferase [Woeseiaceae bacterium]